MELKRNRLTLRNKKGSNILGRIVRKLPIEYKNAITALNCSFEAQYSERKQRQTILYTASPEEVKNSEILTKLRKFKMENEETVLFPDNSSLAIVRLDQYLDENDKKASEFCFVIHERSENLDQFSGQKVVDEVNFDDLVNEKIKEDITT